MSDLDPVDKPPAEPEPTTPPAGTTATRFWESGAFKGALVVTVGLGLMFLRAWIMEQPVSREAVAMSAEAVVWAWLGAIGIHQTDKDALRWR